MALATIASWLEDIAEGMPSSPEELRRSAKKYWGSAAADLEAMGLLK